MEDYIAAWMNCMIERIAEVTAGETPGVESTIGSLMRMEKQT